MLLFGRLSAISMHFLLFHFQVAPGKKPISHPELHFKLPRKKHPTHITPITPILIALKKRSTSLVVAEWSVWL